MNRSSYLEAIEKRFSTFKVVALLGSRQVGKTTIARQYCEGLKEFNWKTHYFDLEDPTALVRLENPKLALQNLEGLVVIDEIQRSPELFPVLRYLLDRKENKLQLLILGSASRDLIQQSSESLAGRISYMEVHPFSLDELRNETDTQEKLWLRGGYPLAYLANNDESSFEWISEYVRTYLERDIPALGITIPATTLRRFWAMLSHNHASLLNSSELGRSFGVADTTIKRYLDILSDTFMVRQLQPYITNTKKRLVKSPKIYFRDSGILHYFFGVGSEIELTTHIKLGASWEGFALEQVIRRRHAKPEECYFWAIHSQGEIDLLIEKNGILEAYEFKYSEQAHITKSMNAALEALPISSITIVSPVDTVIPLREDVVVKPLSAI